MPAARVEGRLLQLAAQPLVDPAQAVVGRAQRGARRVLVQHHAGRQHHRVAGEVLVREIDAGQHLVVQAEPVEGVGVVQQRVGGAHVLHLVVGAPGQDRHGADRVQPLRRARAVGVRVGSVVLAEANRARALVAVVAAVAQRRPQLAAAAEAVLPAERAVGGAAGVVVAGRAVVHVVGVEPGDQHRRVRAGLGRADAHPRQPVVDAVVVVQVEDRRVELVAAADAEAVAQRRALLVDEVAVVVGGVAHQVQAQRRAVAGLHVEVAQHPQEAVAAAGDADHVGVVQERLLGDLVDHAAGRAAAEQHRRRAAQQLDPVEVEGVAVVEARVVDGVDVQVVRHREAAQPHVLLAALAGEEADAAHQPQRLVQRVDLAVLHQPLGDHGHRLRDVALLLRAAADVGGGRAQRRRVGLGPGLHGDRRHRRAAAVGRRGRCRRRHRRRRRRRHLRQRLRVHQPEARSERAQRQQPARRRLRGSGAASGAARTQGLAVAMGHGRRLRSGWAWAGWAGALHQRAADAHQRPGAADRCAGEDLRAGPRAR